MKNASLSFSNPAPALTTGMQKIGLALIALSALRLLFYQAFPFSEALPSLIAAAVLITGVWLFVREEGARIMFPKQVLPATLLALGGGSLLFWAWFAGSTHNAGIMLGLAGVLSLAAAAGYMYTLYFRQPEGIKNNGVWFSALSARGIWGWLFGILFTEFYICLYWFPEQMSGLVDLFSPLSQLLQDRPANQWFVYGTLYTASVLLLGLKFIYKYRGNRYQLIRTISVMFFQLGFAWLLPGLLVRMQQPEIYFTYFWPLSSYQGTPMAYQGYMGSSLGTFFFFFGLAMFFVATPVLTYFFGKRWYCSWVCGCGGLAETTGDAFRHLSDKSLKAWKIERWMIYSILALVFAVTALLWLNVYTQQSILQSYSPLFYKTYSFLIGSAFSGVIGVGFYPLLGSRVWCRFGCPMAAWLGIWQKKASKFRITVNGGQCISCGNCSTYCEMGIDVRHYAQRGQDIVRASCVGCGVCSAVCPRGVLRLEGAAADFDRRAQEPD